VKKSAILCVAAGLSCGVANAGGPVGPDVIVGDMPSIQYYGQVGTIRAYSVATTSCNIGDTPLEWFDGTNRHPVIGQTMYRVNAEGTRIEQLGQSWLKHGFAALTGNVCDTCQNPGSFSLLGVGCSDPYSSGLNGQQSNLGTKTEVNAYSGFFNWPFGGRGQSGNAIFKRLQVEASDMTAGGTYYVGSQYVTPDDAAAGNQNNNASYRPVTVNGTSVFPTSFTRREQAPIYAWKAVNPNVDLQEVFVPGEGMFNLAALAIDNGDGTWTYEYALHNQTSHRSADSFAVPGASVSTGFHDVEYHSGDGYDQTDWSASEGAGMVTWSAADAGINTNALRWGTMYNFTITTDTPPTTGEVEIGLYRSAFGIPGSSDVVLATTVVPSVGAAGCNAADNAEPFGVLDLADVQGFVAAFTSQGPAADIAEPFDVWDLADVQLFVAEFTGGCP
jgi:hypothetical protein